MHSPGPTGLRKGGWSDRRRGRRRLIYSNNGIDRLKGEPEIERLIQTDLWRTTVLQLLLQLRQKSGQDREMGGVIWCLNKSGLPRGRRQNFTNHKNLYNLASTKENREVIASTLHSI